MSFRRYKRQSTPTTSYIVQTYTTGTDLLEFTSEAVTESLRWASRRASEALGFTTTSYRYGRGWITERSTWTDAANWDTAETETEVVTAGIDWGMTEAPTTVITEWGMTEAPTTVITEWGMTEAPTTELATEWEMTEAPTVEWESTTDRSSYSPVKTFWETVKEITESWSSVETEARVTGRNSPDTSIAENPGVVTTLESRDPASFLPPNTLTESFATAAEEDEASMWTSEKFAAIGWMSSAAVLVLLLTLLIWLCTWKILTKLKTRSVRIKNSAGLGNNVKLTEIRSSKQTGPGTEQESKKTKME
ncbi:hypothetical protein ACHWQZ_G007431 [Mnemiopsis leidyi]